ncbi:MAG: hypothetical protein KDJ36_10635 [Hyphomicrobiaceae bacterium]|nr:hypothetical protein [Hyphomicrobiaceae bacterium]
MQLTHRPEDFPGFFATVLWVGIGVWLFWTTPGAAFLSWQAAIYFIFGTLAVGLFFGIIGLTMQRLIPVLKPAPGAAKPPGGLAQVVGTLYGVAQFVVVYFLAKSVVTKLLFTAPVT